MTQPAATLFDRTLETLTRVLRDVAGSARVRLTGQLRPDLPDDDLLRLKKQIDDCLHHPGGEVSQRAQAAALGRAFLALSEEGRRRFYTMLLGEYGTDRDEVDRAIAQVQAAGDPEARFKAERALAASLRPPRLSLLTHFNALPEGVKFLVDLRADLQAHVKADRTLKPLDDDLRDLLASWFDIGFLDLERITWSAPATLLERLIAYEAVHEIRSWADLKNRLDSDRRCFAFFHPRMPEEPLIFVEVALVQGMSGSVQRLLDEKAPVLDPRQADTAVFYSINNCQRGLDGISFGNFLIKRVVGVLSDEMRNIKQFCTLSPIPGYRKWLDETLAAGAIALTEEERKALRALAPLLPPLAEGAPEPDETAILRGLLARRPPWREEATQKVLEPLLIRLCARYLLKEEAPRRPGRARDPVAHFHLSNGARIERVNWRADISDNGLRQSHGLMVNYLYDPERIEDHHEAYVGEGRRAASAAIRKLAKA